MQETRARKNGRLLVIATSVFLCACAPLPPCPARMLVYAALTGILPLMFLRARWGAVSLLLLSLPTGLILWSGLTLVLTTLAGPQILAASPWVLLGLLALIAGYARYQSVSAKRPMCAAVRFRPIPAEWCALVVALLAAVPLLILAHQNGADASHRLLILQKWMTGDPLYMCALAETVLARGGWPAENPFMAGIGNYYPSFFHCGLAGLTSLSGQAVYETVCSWMILHGSLSAGLAVLACGRMAGSMRKWHGAVLGTLAVIIYLLLRYDLMLLPTTNFMVMPVLFCVAWLLGNLQARKLNLRAFIAAAVVILTLVLGHTMSAAAAISLFACCCAVSLERPHTRRIGLVMSAFLCALCALFLLINTFPYSGSIGYMPRDTAFSLDIIRRLHLPLLIPLAVCVALCISARRPVGIRFAIPLVLASGVGLAYTLSGYLVNDGILSWFKIINAPRLTQTALLFALPVAAYATSRRKPTALLLVLATVMVFLLVPYPIAESVRESFSATAQTVENPSADQDGILNFLRTQTAPTDVVSSNEGHLVAGLTGRPELLPDKVNGYGMDTIPPQDFHAMRDCYRRLWSQDSGTSDTSAAEARAETAKALRIRWLVGMGQNPAETDAISSGIIHRFPAGFVTHIKTTDRMTLFLVNLEKTNDTQDPL